MTLLANPQHFDWWVRIASQWITVRHCNRNLLILIRMQSKLLFWFMYHTNSVVINQFIKYCALNILPQFVNISLYSQSGLVGKEQSNKVFIQSIINKTRFALWKNYKLCHCRIHNNKFLHFLDFCPYLDLYPRNFKYYVYYSYAWKTTQLPKGPSNWACFENLRFPQQLC